MRKACDAKETPEVRFIQNRGVPATFLMGGKASKPHLDEWAGGILGKTRPTENAVG